jgi:hypothetical protein
MGGKQVPTTIHLVEDYSRNIPAIFAFFKRFIGFREE